MEKIAFSNELLDQLKANILQAKQQNSGPHYAAFDADGTLWNSDLGEQFFQYQIDHCQLETLHNIDPWEYYETTKSSDPIKAYLWLAQISIGQSLTQVRTWAQEATEKMGAHVFESQKNLISWLQEQDIEVFIVTASVQWAVEPAGKLVSVPFENVIGIQTMIDNNGLVTGEQFGPITWRQGKADALLKRTNGVKPIFCSGNTYGDIALLETSVGDRLCIQTQTKENSLFLEEKKLRDHAELKGWKTHSFY